MYVKPVAKSGAPESTVVLLLSKVALLEAPLATIFVVEVLEIPNWKPSPSLTWLATPMSALTYIVTDVPGCTASGNKLSVAVQVNTVEVPVPGPVDICVAEANEFVSLLRYKRILVRLLTDDHAVPEAIKRNVVSLIGSFWAVNLKAKTATFV